MADFLDVGLDLLDRQVVDAEKDPMGKVDDVLFHLPEHGPPQLVAVLIGQQAFGRRIGGRFGRWWTAVAARLSGREGPVEVPMERVRELGPVVRIDGRVHDFPALRTVEEWLARSLVGRLPGADREGG